MTAVTRAASEYKTRTADFDKKIEDVTADTDIAMVELKEIEEDLSEPAARLQSQIQYIAATNKLLRDTTDSVNQKMDAHSKLDAERDARIKQQTETISQLSEQRAAAYQQYKARYETTSQQFIDQFDSFGLSLTVSNVIASIPATPIQPHRIALTAIVPPSPGSGGGGCGGVSFGSPRQSVINPSPRGVSASISSTGGIATRGSIALDAKSSGTPSPQRPSVLAPPPSPGPLRTSLSQAQPLIVPSTPPRISSAPPGDIKKSGQSVMPSSTPIVVPTAMAVLTSPVISGVATIEDVKAAARDSNAPSAGLIPLRPLGRIKRSAWGSPHVSSAQLAQIEQKDRAKADAAKREANDLASAVAAAKAQVAVSSATITRPLDSVPVRAVSPPAVVRPSVVTPPPTVPAPTAQRLSVTFVPPSVAVAVPAPVKAVFVPPSPVLASVSHAISSPQPIVAARAIPVQSSDPIDSKASPAPSLARPTPIRFSVSPFHGAVASGVSLQPLSLVPPPLDLSVAAGAAVSTPAPALAVSVSLAVPIPTLTPSPAPGIDHSSAAPSPSPPTTLLSLATPSSDAAVHETIALAPIQIPLAVGGVGAAAGAAAAVVNAPPAIVEPSTSPNFTELATDAIDANDL